MEKRDTYLSSLLLIILIILIKPAFAEDKVYAIQIGAFEREANAQAMVSELEVRGCNAYTRGREGKWTKVYLGRFDSWDEAEKGAVEFKKQGAIKGEYLIRKVSLPQGVKLPQRTTITSPEEPKRMEIAQATKEGVQDSPSVKEVKTSPSATDETSSLPSTTTQPEPVADLAEGIRQYKEENYEEAIEIFKAVRLKEPANTTAAFFLGLAYKQTNDFIDALPQFRDAVTFKPPVKEAFVELVEVLIQLERIEEAERWAKSAEESDIYPAKVAFLKGMIMMKKGRYGEAVQHFEKAKSLEKSYAQAAEFQIGLAMLADRQFSKAKERFQAAVTADPLSDLGSFARRYQDIAVEQSFLQRPLRLTLSVMGQYDTNMLQEPSTFSGIPDSGRERSFVLQSGLRLDYVPVLPGRWLFNGGYAVTNRVHEENSTTYDTLAQTFSIAPGYDFGRFALNLSANYTFLMKRGDYLNEGGGYRRYSENFTIGPLLRFLATPNHIFELYGGYAKKNYFKPAPAGNPGDDMSAGGLDSYLSWAWIFENGGFFNTRFAFTVDNADGFHYDAKQYRLTVNLMYPLWKKLSLQAGGEYAIVLYRFENEFWNNYVRGDQIYIGTVGFSWSFNKYLTGIIQYTGTRNYSNIPIYDYSRSLWSAGCELRF